MADNLTIHPGTKQEQYEQLLPQIRALMTGEPNRIANLANIAAALKEQFNWLWVGFYLVENDELVLGPFQGPIACTRIRYGKGVCGTCWAKKETVIVPDVAQFPGHIACSSRSKSEIVIPLMHEGTVWGVLDVDSETMNAFDTIDATYLGQLAAWIQP
ncbi:MAG: GAF domain-containing protein [Ferruginibacter sp.]